MAAVEEVYVQAAEVLCIYARMVPARTVRVLDEPVHTVPVAPAAQFVGAVREGRGEISRKSALLRYGNLPYPEETCYHEVVFDLFHD